MSHTAVSQSVTQVTESLDFDYGETEKSFLRLTENSALPSLASLPPAIATVVQVFMEELSANRGNLSRAGIDPNQARVSREQLGLALLRHGIRPQTMAEALRSGAIVLDGVYIGIGGSM